MDYKEAIQYLDSFINYEKIGYKSQRAFKLERMLGMAQLFGNPHESFPSIHITGTKGKGSIASFISNILREAGFTVGLYTSPHLLSPRERIRINNEMISESDFAFYAGEIKRKLESENLNFSPTFFEIYTMLAFNYFKAKKIDYGVIEVGLGGRLDATNIINPLVSVISPISYDHTQTLGDTLEKIAVEKCGIVKKDCVCLSAPQERDVLEVIRERCGSLGVELVLLGKDIRFKELCHDAEKEIFDIQGLHARYEHCVSRLIGHHQILNAACAVGTAESLKKMGLGISEENIKRGIEKTEHPGRCEIIAKRPYIVLDGAQNIASAGALESTIKRNFKYERLVLVLGISKDKDIKGVCEKLVPLADEVILTKAKIARAEEPRQIARYISGKEVLVTNSVKEAMEKARSLAAAQDLILVTGSFFVVGEAITQILSAERRFTRV